MSTKRAVELAEKLSLPQNAHLRPRAITWIEESRQWASMMIEKYGPNRAQKTHEGYQLLYVLNHLCPNLHHYHPMPNPRIIRIDVQEYNRKYRKYFTENTQAALTDDDGTLIQEGVEYTPESFDAFCETALRICNSN